MEKRSNERTKKKKGKRKEEKGKIKKRKKRNNEKRETPVKYRRIRRWYKSNQVRSIQPQLYFIVTRVVSLDNEEKWW